MGCCYIFNKSFLMDADIDSATIDLTQLSNLIPAYSEDTSGIWRPIIIKDSNTNLNKVDFLMEAGDTLASIPFNPLNCSPQVGTSYSALLENGSFDCEYCKKTTPTNHNTTWSLKDSDGNLRQVLNNQGFRVTHTYSSDCCSGACDTRVRPDDFIPKIPVLNQNYLNKFYDFKYLNQFPSTTNPGLGFNEFIRINISNMSSFSSGPDLVIDWRIKDSISETHYNPLESQYNNIFQHSKAIKKSNIVSKTCGNFILTKVNQAYTGINPYYPSLSGLIGDSNQSLVSNNVNEILPSVENFIAPYGFEKSTYNNIFIKNKKTASYWKWNYESGVLCWYRYFDRNMINDQRPISGVDLYIPPGDVFYANNEGPEPPPVLHVSGTEIKSCPSGLKVLESGAISSVISSGSSFTYISQNLYDKFLYIFNRLSLASKTDNTPKTMKEKFDLAALLCTAPEYDEITVDLMSRNKKYDYSINSYFQIDILNKDMLKGTSYGSVGKLNYIKNKKDLINTLSDKYGSYLWFPPNTTKKLTLKNSIDSQCFIDMDFDAVAIKKDTSFTSSNCITTKDCSYNLPSKQFTYEQKITLGQVNLDLKLDIATRYKTECSGTTNNLIGSSRIAGLYLNNNLFKEVPYNTGCYVFQDNYPRILTTGTPTDTCCNSSGINCNTCDADSTYYLVGGPSALCKGYDGDLSWCDGPSAGFYNNSQGSNNIGTRPARNILNNTLYFKRSYSAVAFNPHIDNIAFHHQGGVYFSNNIFGSLTGTTVFVGGVSGLFDASNKGTLSIEFRTNDLGIKLYSLSVEKLRSNNLSTHQCRAFPIKDKCKCYGLSTVKEYPYTCNNGKSIVYTNIPIVYTPNISTTFSPLIKAYGGYSEAYINEILGGGEISNQINVLKQDIEYLNQTIDFMELSDLAIDKDGNTLQGFRNFRASKSGEIDKLTYALSEYRIPNHPDPGRNLPILDKYINPLKPYGDEQSVTIDLKNYVTTSYTVSLPSYSTTHADIWAQVLENVDFIKQRYATKAIINNVTIYDQQRKAIVDAGASSSSVNIKLSNPYLEALLGGEHILYPPVNSLCNPYTKSDPFAPMPSNFGSKGDEISNIGIKISRVPRRQLLNFFVKTPKEMGILKKGFFHPNSGLIDRETKDPALTPLIKDNNHNIYISYDKDLFEPSSSFKDTGVVFYDTINDSLKRVMEQISNFNNHRKARLYLKLDSVWYEYKNPNLFGFYNQNTLYVGEPFIFEYLEDEKEYSVIGPCIPISAKKHLDFNFIYNYPHKDIPIVNPRSVILKNKQRPKEIIIDGSRAYFSIGEKDSARISLSSTIEGLSQSDMDAITLEKPELVLANRERYRYVDGDKNNKKSYIISDYNYLYHNFSDLHINYNLKNKTNYIFNTKKQCDQKVLIINAENTKKTYYAKIKEKKLYAIYVDEYGNKLKFNDKTSKKYIKVYTQLTLDTSVRYDNIYVDFTCLFDNASNAEGMDSIIVLRNLLDNQAIKKENDTLLFGNKIQSKWGDLLDYDDNITSELTKYFINKKYIYDVYPSSVYNNNFNKIIYNNGNYLKHHFILRANNNTARLNLSDDVYFNIHQKYNIDYGIYDTQYDFWKHNNYLPYMDINILPTGNNTNTSRSIIKDNLSLNTFIDNNDKILSGIINISGLYQKLDGTHDWKNYKKPDNGKYFWINLDTQSQLLSAVSPKTGFYTESMRIDQPTFQLNSINYETNTLTNIGCRSTFYPVINNETTSFVNNNHFDFSHFSTITTGSIFDLSPIYCDKDLVVNCSNTSCDLPNIGTGTYSGNYNFYSHKSRSITPNINNIPYMIMYDAGLYNPLGSRNLSYISRHELDITQADILFPVSVCNSSLRPRPLNYQNSILNPEYQNIMTNSLGVTHDAIVTKTDTMANEILFRLLYGEQQKINYERIDGSNDRSIKLEDLYRYSDPRIEAKDIYKNISYDLDTSANADDLKINGNIDINGILRLNKLVSVSIHNIDMSFQILRDSNTGDINISFYDGLGNYTLSKIYSTQNTTTSIVVATNQVSPASPTETVTLLKVCKERRQISIGMGNRVTSAKIITCGCSDPVGIPEAKLGCHPDKTEERNFPFWQYSEVVGPLFRGGNLTIKSVMPDGGFENPRGTPCPRNYVERFGGACKNTTIVTPTGVKDTVTPPDIYFAGRLPCTNVELLDPYYTCTNRDVGPLPLPYDCTEITRIKAEEMEISKFNRGLIIPYSECYRGGHLTKLFNNGCDIDLGNIESAISTTTLDNPRGISLNPRYQTGNCGRCFSIDFKDWTGLKHYDPLFSEFNIGSTSTSDACECRDYTYGYCENSDNASSCSCVGLTYEYTKFPYNFEKCETKFSLQGHKRRIKGLVGDSKDPLFVSNPTPRITIQENNTPINKELCELKADTALGADIPKVWTGTENISLDPKLTITEECLWAYKEIQPQKDYYIHLKINTINNAPYNPKCSQALCNITYDNNLIKVKLAGDYSSEICIPITIRNTCPLIKVTVPDDEFSVVDNINSSCDECCVNNNKAIINDTHPVWEITTETRTCVLGYVLTNNPNTNGPVGTYHNYSNIGLYTGSYGGQVRTNCNPQPAIQYGLCGKNAPDSYPWNVCISKNGGSLCVKGNCQRGNYDPQEPAAPRSSSNPYKGYSGPPTVLGCDIPVTYPIETSNPEAKEIFMEEWQNNMNQIYLNIAACYNKGPAIINLLGDDPVTTDNDRSYNISDIVEGIVPASCSELKYASVSFPGIKYKATFGDPVVSEHNITAMIAYYTYKYRKPKTIQDILKGEEIAKKCNEQATQCNTNFRISSNYNTTDCQNIPICYDTKTENCVDNNHCCNAGKIDYA
jgi:hypothetical protein